MDNNNQQNFNSPQQPPINPTPSPSKLNNKIVVAIILVVIAVIAVVAGYVALKWGKTNISPITTEPTGETQQVSNDVSKKIVGPLTVQPLMPVVEMDQPSASYKNSIIQIQHDNISEEIQKPLKDTILKSDLEIISRNVDSLDSLFSILYTNGDNSLVLYVMTPTGTSCTLPGEMGFSCDNAKLKILNTKDNSINLLTNNFGDIYLSVKDNSIIVFGDSKYEIFNLSKPYSLRESTPSGFSSLLINEYTISYNQKTSNLVIENILNNKKISCAITNTGVKNALKNNFNSSHLSLSPNGNKIILFEGDNKFFWNDISSQWSSNSSDCLNNANEAEISGVKSVSRMGKWYSNANYFAYSDYGDNTFIYNFGEQKQVFFMPWKNTIGVGYLNNSGYRDTASIDEKVYKVIVVPGEKQISVYFEMPDGKRYLVSNYSDKSSTQAFYQLTQQYPVNSAGDYTYGKLADAGVPKTWIRIKKDNTDKNLYHLLVSDGYNVRQALAVSVASTVGNNSTNSNSTATGNEQKVLATAREVIGALATRDYQKLGGLVSPDGLSLNLYPSLDLKKNLIVKSDISLIPTDTKIYFWGYTDGKGDPINLTRAQFLTTYIYSNSVDYLEAPDVAVNKILGSGNSGNSIEKDVNGRTYVAFHFSGFDPNYGGMDWTTLYLVFDSVNGEYKLRGITKDNWTI